MSKFKIGDVVVITAQTDGKLRHYHPIGAECKIMSGEDSEGNYEIKSDRYSQWASSACFKLKAPIKLENK